MHDKSLQAVLAIDVSLDYISSQEFNGIVVTLPSLTFCLCSLDPWLRELFEAIYELRNEKHLLSNAYNIWHLECIC